MIPSCIPLMQAVALNIVIAQNKHKFRAIVYLCIAVVNVLGTILVISNYGIVGAAVVSGIAFIIGQGFIMNWYYWKKIKLDIPKFWLSVLKIILLGVVLCAITLLIIKNIVIDSWGIMLVCIIVYTLIFCVLQWCFAMNDYEKSLFVSPLKKIYRKIKKTA